MKTSLPKQNFYILVLLFCCLGASQAFGQIRQTFNTSGTFTVPAGVTSITVQAWGAGGGGGKGRIGTVNGSSGGAGGGGGAYVIGTLAVTPSSTLTVTVGTGGNGATATTNATGGAASTVSTLIAGGGGAGGNNGALGGAAGTASGGSTNLNGTNGSASNTNNGASGGNAANIAGGGGTGGAGGNGTNVSGNAGNDFGGGGGGAGKNSTDGGNGANGVVIITYYLFSSVSATSNFCPGNTSTITVSAPAADLPVGTYPITYSLSGANTGTNLSTTMTVSPAGTGTFSTITLANPGSTTLTITNISNGTISMAPSGSTTATITVNPQPTPGTLTKVQNTLAVCSGADVSATATAGAGGAGTTVDVLQYRFDGGSWETYTSGTLLSTAGRTTVDIRTYRTASGSGCSQSSINTVSWTVNARPAVTIGKAETSGTTANDGTICNGASVTLTGNASGTRETYTYSWAINGTSFSTLQTVPVSPQINTDYLLTVTDGNGCTNTETVKISVNDLPIASISVAETSGTTNDDGIICTGSSASLTASGGTSYSWSTGAITAVITVAPTAPATQTTTTYTVTAKDANGCLAQASRSVIVNPLPTVSPITGTFSVCVGSTTTLSNTNSGTWSSLNTSVATVNSATGEVTGVTAGTATIQHTVTNGNGCTQSTTATVTVNALPTFSGVSSSTTAICSGTGAIITVSGLLPNKIQTIDYTIAGGNTQTTTVTSDGAGVATFTTTGLSAANSGKTLTITGINRTDVTPGCVLSPSNATTTLPTVESVDLTAPVIDKPVAINDPSVCAGQMLTVDITTPGSGGTGAQDEFRYTTNGGASWSAWSTTKPSFAAVVGTTTIEARRYAPDGVCKASGTNSQSWTVVAKPTISAPSPAAQTVCLATTPEALTVNASGGTGNFSYQWYSNATNSNTGGAAIGSATNATFTPPAGALGTTYYYSVVTDAGTGCGFATSATAAVTVNAQPVSGSLTKGASVNQDIVCRGTNVSASLTNGSGAGTDILEYSYDDSGIWISYASGTDISTAGHTKVEVRTYRAAIGTNCTPSAAVSVSWSLNPRPTVTVSTTETSGNTNDDGTICTGASVVLKGAGSVTPGPYSYAWVTGATTIANIQDVTVSPTANTDYLLTVTDGNGCTRTEIVTINVNSLPKPAITVAESPLTGTQDGTICTGGSVTLTASGGTSYAWNTGSVNSAITVSPTAPTAQTTTTYSVDVKDANGCSAQASRSVIVNPLPIPTLTATTATTCAGTDIVYSTEPGQSNYVWTLPTPSSSYTIVSPIGGITPTTSSVTLRWNTGGIKTVSVNYKNSDGCSANNSASVTTDVKPLPGITTSGTLVSLCQSNLGQTTTLTYSAPVNNPNSYSIDWNSAANTVGLIDVATTASSFTSGTISDIVVSAGVPAGNYSGTLIISNADGCTSTQAVTLTIYGLPTINTAAAASPVCYNSAAAQTATLTYSSTTNSPTTYSIAWDAAPANSFAAVNDASLTPGQISIAVPAGTTAGTYTGNIIVKNAGGCASTATPFSITVNALPVVANITGPGSVCIGSTVTLANATGGGVWTTLNPSFASVSTAGVVSGIAAGSATIVYTTAADANGCKNSSNASVIVNPLPTITTSGTLTSVCLSASAQTTTMAYSVTTNTPVSYSIDWNTAANAAKLVDQATTAFAFTPSTGTIDNIVVPANVPAGSYAGTMTITNGNGCSTTQAVTLVVNPVTTISSQPVAATYCQNAANAVALSVTAAGTGPFTYQWFQSTTNANSGGTAVSSSATYVPPTNTAGTSWYYVVVSGTCGTATSTAVSVQINPATAISAQTMPTATYCLNATNAAALSVTAAGTGTLSYQWYRNTNSSNTGGASIPNANNPTYTPSTTTTGTTYYYAIVTGGCGQATSAVSGAIVINPLPTATITPATTTVCKDATLPTVTFTGAGGTAPYTFTYTLNDGTTTTTKTVTSANGSSSVTVPQSTGTPGTYTYTLVSVKDATTTECSQAQSGTAVITVDAPTVSGSISKTFVSVCQNAAGGTLTLENYVGSIKWQYSNDGGANWIYTGNTSASQSYTTTQTRLYRAEVQNGVCAIAYSNNAVISVDPITTPTATANPAEICVGQSATLNATTGLPSGAGSVQGGFVEANPAGWCVDGKCTGGFMPADGDNTENGPWRQSSSHPFNGVTYNTPNPPRFAIASGNFTTTLETPIFSLIGQSTASLSMFQAYVLKNNTTSATIEISTDGGVTYKKVLAQYVGPSTFGLNGDGSIANLTSTNISLDNYLGLSNLRIKFTYKGSANSAWAIDGMQFQGPDPDLTYVWTSSAGPLNTSASSVTVSPTVTTTYTLNTSLNGCPGGSNPVTVRVNPLPEATISVSDEAACQNGAAPKVTFTGTKGTSPYTFRYTVNDGTTTTTHVISTASGSNSVTITPSTAIAGTFTFTLVDVSDNTATRCSQTQNGTVKFTVVRPIVISSPAFLPPQCWNSKVTLSFTVTGDATSYQWFKDGAPVTSASATYAPYIINSMSPASAGKYYLAVKGTSPCSDANSGLIDITTYSTDYTEWTSSQETGIDPIEWHEEKNWTCGIPNLYRDALVPIVSNNKYPYVDNLPDTGGKVRNLVIAAGGPNLRIDGTLKIAGNVTNNGKIDGYLNGINSTGTIEFVSNLNYYGTTGGYPGNGNNASPLILGGSAGEHDTRTQHLKISNLVSSSIPVDVYGQLSFAGNNRNLSTGDALTLKSVSSTISAMVTDRTDGNKYTNNNITGKVTVERFIDGGLGRGWRLLTAPVTGITFKEAWQENRLWNGVTPDTQSPGFGTLITGQQQGNAATANANGYDFWPEIANSASSIRYYQGASDWTLAKWWSLSHLNWRGFGKTEAYLLFVRGDRSVTTGSGTTILRPKGLLKEDLVHNVTVMAGQSHTLIGNPYASPLNFRKIYKANSSIVEPYFWVNNTALGDVGGYSVIRPKTTNVDGEYEAVPEFTTSGKVVPPVVSSGEGFFVVPKQGVSLPATISIGQTHKDVVKSEYPVFRMPGRGPAKLFVNALEVRTNGDAHLLDGILAEFDEKPVQNISKVTNSGENLAVVEKSTDWIVTASKLPKVGDTVQLRFWNTSAKTYRFRLRSENFSIPGIAATLVDRFEKKETPLAMGDAVTPYEFTITNNAASKDPFRFYIVFQMAPLPVAILDAAETRGGVQLQWSVPEDLTVSRYELEKSIDGNTFTAINQTASRASAVAQQYGHLDKQPAMVTHYRVKLTGITGKTGYSNTVTVELKQASGLTIFPNPVAGSTASLQFTAKPQGRYTLVVYAPTGQQVASQVVEHSGGTATYAIPVGSLASGSYTLELWHPDNRKEKIRLVVTH